MTWEVTAGEQGPGAPANTCWGVWAQRSCRACGRKGEQGTRVWGKQVAAGSSTTSQRPLAGSVPGGGPHGSCQAVGAGWGQAGAGQDVGGAARPRKRPDGSEGRAGRCGRRRGRGADPGRECDRKGRLGRRALGEPAFQRLLATA